MKVDGACACGAIRVEAEADPDNTNICHCTDCQAATGTTFRGVGSGAGREFEGHRRAQYLCEEDGRQRYSASPGVLRHLRLAALFDDSR